MLKRLLVGTLAVGALLVLAVAPAVAQYAEPATLTSTEGRGCAPGSPVTLTVTGAVPGTDVTFIFQPDAVVLGIATADANGVAALQTAWPVTASAGVHTVIAQGLDGEPDGPVPLELSIEVDCSAAVPGALARTGSDSLPWARVGIVLVALGGIILLTTRKRYAVVRETV